jgi:hypothetical protein
MAIYTLEDPLQSRDQMVGNWEWLTEPAHYFNAMHPRWVQWEQTEAVAGV